MRTDLLPIIGKKLEPHNTQKEIANELGWVAEFSVRISVKHEKHKNNRL